MSKPDQTDRSATANDKIETQVSKALDQSLEQLSPRTQAQLRQARERALATAGKKTGSMQWLRPVPIGGAAFALCLLMVLVWPSLQTVEHSLPSLAFEEGLEDLILVSEMDEETLALVEEIEFAYWLAQEIPDDRADGTESDISDYPLEGRIDRLYPHGLNPGTPDALGVHHNG